MSQVQEHALAFALGDETLFGLLHEPERSGDIGVVVVVGGPQVRAGSHRQFVLLARALADAGVPVLRFDVRGMGDSDGEARDFESLTPDIGVAIDALQARLPAVRRIVLWGLCDAASAALLYLDETADARVAGLCLLNPWVRSAQTYARTQVQHYYRGRLLERAFWAKLMRGGVGLGALRGFVADWRAGRRAAPAPAPSAAALPYQARMARAWTAFEGPMLLILSGRDLTAREFVDSTAGDPAWRAALEHPGLSRIDLADADHTFSSMAWRRRVESLTISWLQAWAGEAAVAPPPSNGRVRGDVVHRAT